MIAAKLNLYFYWSKNGLIEKKKKAKINFLLEKTNTNLIFYMLTKNKQKPLIYILDVKENNH